MRKFKLWNQARTLAFDFNAQNCPISDVSGLGTNFLLGMAEHSVVSVDPNFEDITLKVNYGVNANPYASYTLLTNFIQAIGKARMLLEYQFNNRALYCDVWIKEMPKTQIKSYGIIEENLVFLRGSYWFTFETIQVVASPNKIGITNSMFEDYPVVIRVEGPTSSDFAISNLSNGEQLSLLAPLQLDDALIIDGNLKKVYLEASYENKYSLLNKANNTFLTITPGQNEFAYTGTAASVTLDYRKLVLG